MEEDVEYREVVGFPDYRVGRDGKVWSRRWGRWKRVFGSFINGYLFVCLMPGAVRKPVAHVVLEAFAGPRPEGTEACHYPDANPANNRVENLRWDTQLENAKDRWRHRIGATEKRCPRCKKDLPLDAFSASSVARDGRQCYCVPCAREKQKVYQARRLCRKLDSNPGRFAKTRNSESGG